MKIMKKRLAKFLRAAKFLFMSTFIAGDSQKAQLRWM